MTHDEMAFKMMKSDLVYISDAFYYNETSRFWFLVTEDKP